MTILAYWAWSAFDARRPNTMHSAQGAGGLGYGFPAALGAAAADPTTPVLAVSGDGGAMYSIAELATARQYDLPLTWLIVDDGGYGILREYMTGAFGEATAHRAVPPGLRRPRRVLRRARRPYDPGVARRGPGQGAGRARPVRGRAPGPAADVRADASVGRAGEGPPGCGFGSLSAWPPSSPRSRPPPPPPRGWTRTRVPKRAAPCRPPYARDREG